MKICPTCRREYEDGLNFCFDDGQRLEPATATGAQACPRCLLRFGRGTSECPRDGVPLVSAIELDRVRERICSECGAAAPDPTAEFCGIDGARILARWEVGLVTRTAVTPMDESPETAKTLAEIEPPPFDSQEKLRTAPDRPLARGLGESEAQPPPPSSVSPEVISSPPPVAPAPVPTPSAAASAPSAPLSPASSAVSSAWFLSAAGDGAAPDAGDDLVIPTRVSRKLIAVTASTALLFVGALAFALYSRNAASGRRVDAAAPMPAPPAVATTAPAQPSAMPPAVLTPPRTAPTAAAPAPASPVAPAPTPVLEAKAAAPAAAEKDEEDDEPAPKKARRAKARKPKPEAEGEDPSKALDEALRRAARSAPPPAAATAPTPAPLPPAPASPPPAPAAAPKLPEPGPRVERLSRAEANQYFLDAARLYREGRPQEALRRFRILEQLGPRDADLQGRVFLNMAHIYQRLGECAAARRHYQRAQKLIPASSELRPKVEAGLLQVREECK